MDEDSREGQGEISALYVDPSRWRAGVGRALMDEALVRLRAAGCEEVTLWCFEDNARALAFYTKLGFVPDEAREVKYEKQNVRLRMRL
jgi:ribosomal protein S18 acetylase RimI-like enzyme